MIHVEPHPLLDLAAVIARWPAPLGQIATPPWLDALVPANLDDLLAKSPFPNPSDADKTAVRDLLRHGGFKPAGRSKPCNEYIRAVAAAGAFPRVNPAVDATNLAALYGAVPVSTVDLAKLTEDLRVGIAPPASSYIFNRSGQSLDLSGLLCLSDGHGPCANAVKDAHRAKTDEGTTATITLIWGTKAMTGRADAVASWVGARFEQLGAVLTWPGVDRS